MSAVSIPYARAFADVVAAHHLDVNKTMQELRSVAETMRESAELRVIWETPAVTAEEKVKLLDAIAAKLGISQYARNFIAVVIAHRRIHMLAEIVHQVETELGQRMGFADADITSARDLSEAEKRALESRIEIMTGKKVRARYQKDAGILGGAVVRLGSTIYDGSVKGQLARIKEALSQ